MINIDTDKLQIQIDRLSKVGDQMKVLFGQIKNNTEALKNDWESKTSETVFNNFNTFYKILEEVRNDNARYVAYLESIVSNSYASFDANTNKAVNDKLSINS